MMKKSFSLLSFALICVVLFSQEQIQLSNIFIDNIFEAKEVDGIIPLADGEHYSIIEAGKIISKYEFNSGERVEELFSLIKTPIPGGEKICDYVFNKDETKILLTTSRENKYRHSYFAYYYVYDMQNSNLEPLHEIKQQYARLSPDGTKVAFIINNNLYVKDIADNRIKQITFDGVNGSIINGMADWVNEEEFELTKGFEWSPDSKKLAFLRFDESKVKEYYITLFDSVYPNFYKYKYPKAGEKNSIVSANIFDIESSRIIKLNTGSESDAYIPNIKWSPDSVSLAVTTLNRAQNKMEIRLFDSETGNYNVIYKENNKKFITTNFTEYPIFTQDGNYFFVLSEKDGYMHFYRYNIKGESLNQVTRGFWEVDDVLGLDEEDAYIYYTSTEVSPIERHIYRVHYDGSGKEQISKEAGVNKALFSKSFDYYINYNSSSNTTPQVVLYNSNGDLLRYLEDNSELNAQTAKYNFQKREMFSFRGPSGDKLYGYMYTPSEIKKNKQYPVLLYMYGGPGVQCVVDEWSSLQPWFQLLTQKGYVIACIDNRGSLGRGEAFAKSTYKNLGKFELQDQIAAAEYLKTLEFVDGARIGTFGWSYGGYMSLLCLTKGSSIFKTGVAVAPVTNWEFYNSIYTERYMGKPNDNKSGYYDYSPLNFVKDIKAPVLLVHGTADDNVHIQNSMMMADELVKENKPFELQYYTNKNHSIKGGATRYHLYKRITDFILENL